MEITSLKFDLNNYDYNQELCTLEGARDYIQRKIDIVNGFDKFEHELSTLENIKDYIQSKINMVMEKYCKD